MGVVEWLDYVRKLDQLIECKKAERLRLLDLATDISPAVSDGMPRSYTGTVSQKLQDAVVDMVLLESELVRLIEHYIEAKQKAVNLIEKLPEKEYAVMHRYYIQGMTIENIAEDMDYSSRQIKRTKKKALKMLEDVLECHHITVI